MGWDEVAWGDTHVPCDLLVSDCVLVLLRCRTRTRSITKWGVWVAWAVWVLPWYWLLAQESWRRCGRCVIVCRCVDTRVGGDVSAYKLACVTHRPSVTVTCVCWA